jgi:hypothetical protein
MTKYHGHVKVAAARCLAVLFLATALAAQSPRPKFFDDDPIGRDPESQDASAAAPHDIGLFYSLSYNLFVTGRKPQGIIRSRNLNTIDEVPDSGWFTNRIGTRPMYLDEIARGPNQDPAPSAEHWTIVREKSAGFAPGFTARDAGGQTWFVSFDPPSNPEGATGAIAVASKIFWALGYYQVENFITTLRPDQVDIDPGATSRRPSGQRTPITQADLRDVLSRAAKNVDGSYRVTAGRLLPGKVLGGFEYQGTRSDDPNDLVPHEHRRELRALRVFGAWTNLTDMKAGNTLDTVIREGSRGVIRHYLQDVGSTFGMGANGPHDWDEGWEYLADSGPTRRRLFSFGFALSPWQTVDYEDHPAIGLFEGEVFDPLTWKPRVPTAAFVNMRDDDGFWAAQRVMAFSDEAIRAVVKVGQFSDPAAEAHLADVLIKRRDAIGRAYLTRINPIVAPTLDDSNVLTFGNAAVQHGFAKSPSSYRAAWQTFDNRTGVSTPIAVTEATSTRMPAPSGLPAQPGAWVHVSLSAASPDHPSWARPVEAYFRRLGTGWKLVGLEREPDGPAMVTSESR